MSDGLNSIQLVTLCFLFLGFHVLALPAFLWALRHGQFSGDEQAQWTLDDPEAPLAAPAKTSLTPWRARCMLGVLVTVAVLMVSSVGMTLFFAMSAPAHPVTGPVAGPVTGKCPF